MTKSRKPSVVQNAEQTTPSDTIDRDPTLVEVERLRHDVDRLLVLAEMLRKILKEERPAGDQLLVQLSRKYEPDFVTQ